MNDEDRKIVIKLRLENASTAMQESKLMFENEFWNASINRMYYACYYAATALLINNNIETNTHAGVRQMLGLHFIRTGKLSQPLGNFYSNLFTKRHSGDYDDFIFYDKETVEELFPKAYEFIEIIKLLLRNNYP